MKKKILIFFLSVFCVFAVSAKSKTLDNALQEASKRFATKLDSTSKTVAIVDLTSGYDTLDEYLMETMKHNMSLLLKKAVLVERNENVLALIKKENIYQESGAVRDDTIQDIGSALGADCLIFGSVKKVSGGYQILLQAVDIVSKQVLVSYKKKLGKNDKEIVFQIKKSGIVDADLADPLLFVKEAFVKNVEIETLATMYNTKLTYDNIVTYDDIVSRVVTELSHYNWSFGGYDPQRTIYGWIPTNNKQEFAWGVFKVKTEDDIIIAFVSNACVLFFSFANTDDVTEGSEFDDNTFRCYYAASIAASATELHKNGFSFNKAQLTALDNLMLSISSKFFECEDEEDEEDEYEVKSDNLTSHINNDSIINYALMYLDKFSAAGVNSRDLINMALKSGYDTKILFLALDMYAKKKTSANFEVIKWLIKAGANVNAREQNHYGDGTLGDETLLHHILSDRSFDQKDCFKIIPLLLNAGADINAKNRYRMTALTYAVSRIDYDLVKMLIEAGADVNAKGRIGQNLLMQLYFDILDAEVFNIDSSEDLEVFNLLLEAGIDVNAKDIYGNTVLSYWERNKNANKKFIDMLRRAGAK